MEKEGPEKENLEERIKRNYKTVQNYLKGDPGTEGFLDSLADLQISFAEYLIETLKTKKYAEQSNIYQHIRGEKYKYINNEKLEHIISNKVLGKKISIDSLMDEGIQKIKELFDTQKSSEDALEQGKIQSVQLHDVILPPDDLPTPVIGSGNGLEKKELNQNKLLLFISALRKFGIYLDDLIIYAGKIDENMMREASYYAIFIPRENKTVFLNTGYGEATFVCEGQISIEDMTTLGKKGLQSELLAIKISFSQKDIEGWENELKRAILGENGGVGEKINKEEIKEIKNRINKSIALYNIKKWYNEHKDESFTDSEGNDVQIKDLFKSTEYYGHNYKIIKNKYNINLPRNPRISYKMKRNDFLNYLGISPNLEKQTDIISLENLKKFYDKNKDQSFTDSKGNNAQIKDLFKSQKYYWDNYKIIKHKYDINLPGDPAGFYEMKRNDFLNYLGISPNRENDIISLENLKKFYDKNKDESFTDSKGNNAQVKDLFKSTEYYKNNYKIIKHKYDINLPGKPRMFYEMKRNDFLNYLGISPNFEIQTDIISLENLKNFYDEHKDESFIDSKGNNAQVKDLFKSEKYYLNNYKIIKHKYDINLSGNPTMFYGMKRSEIKLYLGIN